MTTTQQQPSAAMAIIDPRHVPMATQVFGEERLSLLAEQVGRGWKVPPTPAELEVIALICQQNRLDVFAKPPQIYFIKRWDSKLEREVMTPQVSVDGLRLIASRSREYIGPGGQQWCGDDGVWKDIWLSEDPPRAARVGVLKRGWREPMYAVALWDEWAQWQDEYRNRQKTGNKVLAPFWRDKPAHMLAKVAEGMILKKAFPAETNQLELAHLEEIHRLEIGALAEGYKRIQGADEDGTALYDLPDMRALPTREREVDDAPRPVDQAASVVVVLTDPAVEGRQVALDGEPTRDELLEKYRALLSQAKRDGVVENAAPWVLRSDTPAAQIITQGRKLRELVVRAAQSAVAAAPTEDPVDPGDIGEGGWAEMAQGDVNSGPASPAVDEARYQEVFGEQPEPPTDAEKAAPRDLTTGEVLDERPPPAAAPKIAAWQENRELVARAQKLGLQGIPVLNTRSAPDVVAEANRVLLERITNLELDQKLAAEQAGHF